jgi:hypothetical protein
MARKIPTPAAQELVDAGLDPREAGAVAVNEREGAKQSIEAPTTATDWVHTTHPDTGTDVVFVPGETLPAWARPTSPTRGTPTTPSATGYDEMNIVDLQALAEARGINHAKTGVKADLIAALEASDEAR